MNTVHDAALDAFSKAIGAVHRSSRNKGAGGPGLADECEAAEIRVEDFLAAYDACRAELLAIHLKYGDAVIALENSAALRSLAALSETKEKTSV